MLNALSAPLSTRLSQSVSNHVPVVELIMNAYQSCSGSFVVLSNLSLIDLDSLFVDSASTAYSFVNILRINGLRESSQGALSKQQVDFFEGLARGLWEEEPNSWNGHEYVPGSEDKVIFLFASVSERESEVWFDHDHGDLPI